MKPRNIMALPMLNGAWLLHVVGKCMLSIVIIMAGMCPSLAETENETEQTAEVDTDGNRLLVETVAATLLDWENSDDPEQVELYNKMNGLATALEDNTAELQKNYEDMKAKEQSDANKLIGAIGIGTVGVGGMQLAAGLSEKSADEAAEMDMQAYLNTFTCRWGDGKSVRGGEVGIELTGGNELFSLVNEYKALAADLKLRKEALGMMPGIESEEILDKATSGLYDDVSLGRADGVYTSLSKALSDENSEDAAEWNAQKEESQKKVKTGAGLAIGGAVVSAAASLIANKDAPKERSAEILAKRHEIQNEITTMMRREIAKCNQKIRDAKNKATEWANSPAWSDNEIMISRIKAIQETPELSEDASIVELVEHPICH